MWIFLDLVVLACSGKEKHSHLRKTEAACLCACVCACPSRWSSLPHHVIFLVRLRCARYITTNNAWLTVHPLFLVAVSRKAYVMLSRSAHDAGKVTAINPYLKGDGK